MAYLYNAVGKPEKTAEKVKYILDNFYKNSPDGLIGNEDCGQMSAWYVLSSMGIYKVTPGSETWETTEPYFKNIKVKIDGSKVEDISQIISKINQSAKDLEVKNDFPLIIPVPVIEAESKSFLDQLKIEIISENPADKIYYSISGSDLGSTNQEFKIYTTPFNIDKTSTIRTYVKSKEVESSIISGTYFKKPNNYSIQIKSPYNSQYNAGGDDGLLDGIYGNENWRKGEWQGYQPQDFEAVIDLKKSKMITDISANFLQDSRSWILMPTKIEFYISDDNKNFSLLKSIIPTVDPKNTEVIIKKYEEKFSPTKARFVKVKAYNFGKLPAWHQGFGSDSFIFIDEIEVK